MGNDVDGVMDDSEDQTNEDRKGKHAGDVPDTSKNYFIRLSLVFGRTGHLLARPLFYSSSHIREAFETLDLKLTKAEGAMNAPAAIRLGWDQQPPKNREVACSVPDRPSENDGITIDQ